MSLTYTIDQDERLVTITGEYAGPDEWREVLDRILADSRREVDFGLLRDLRGARTPTSAQTVVTVIDIVRDYWARLQFSRYAVLTPLEFDSAALVAEALADVAEDLPLRTFTDYDEAIRWLRSR